MSKTPPDDPLSHFLRDPLGSTLDAWNHSEFNPFPASTPKHAAHTQPKISKFTFLDPTNAHEFNVPTWLLLVKTEGPKFGLERFANDIQLANRGGHITADVRDPAILREIAALREDHALAGKMGHAYLDRIHTFPIVSYAGMNVVPDPTLAQDQRALMIMGFDIGTRRPDGIRGPFTDAALKEFAAQSHPPVPAAALHGRLQTAARQAEADADKYTRAGLHNITPAIAHAMRNASDATHSDYSYLMQLTQRESKFDPTVIPVVKKAYTDKHHRFHAAKFGDAQGLFQFEPSTWLSELRMNGEKYGLGRLAAQVVGGKDNPTIKDPETLKYALSLRTDPRINALLGAELQKENHDQAVRISPTFKDSRAAMYAIHFLGGGDGAAFLSGLLRHPDAPAANTLPHEVTENNHGVFFSGRIARTFREIFDSFENSFKNRLFDSAANPTLTASNRRPGGHTPS